MSFIYGGTNVVVGNCGNIENVFGDCKKNTVEALKLKISSSELQWDFFTIATCLHEFSTF